MISPFTRSALHAERQHEGAEESAPPGHEHERAGEIARGGDQSDCVAGVVFKRHDDGVPARQLWPAGAPEDTRVARKSVVDAAQVHIPTGHAAAHRHRSERVLGTGE